MKKIFIIFFFTSFIIGHDKIKENLKWKQYFRLGTVFSENSQLGIAGYARLKRTTESTFKDVRFFSHLYENNTELKLRYKSSQRFLSFQSLYSFNTLYYEKNSILDVNLRYHLNQGLGVIINENNFGNATIEAGAAFDNSDYLNTEQKTTYARSAISFDRNFQSISTKVEVDYFYQISEIYDKTNLSRLELLNEFEWGFSKQIDLIAGFTWTIQKNNKSPSCFITISYKDPLSWVI